MRTIILVRHAKSGWDNANQPDFERTLNKTGKKEAAEISRIDMIISSAANRTVETAQIFAQTFKYDAKEIVALKNLYHAGSEEYWHTIQAIDNTIKTAILLGHNPTITEVACQLSKDFSTDHMPTASLVAAQLNAKKWTDFLPTKANFLFFDFPTK
jgi:phosphohistidine phosphatase